MSKLHTQLLGEVCKLKNGFAFKSTNYTKKGVPVIRISDINDWNVTCETSVQVEVDTSYDQYIVAQNDILVAMSGATTGKFGIYKDSAMAYQNQRVGKFVILDKEKLNPKFLFYQLHALKRQIEKDAYGGAQPNISSKKIEEMLITVPPLSIQRQIVSKIEELFSELDKGIENLKTAQAQLKTYRQSVLFSGTSGQLTHSSVGILNSITIGQPKYKIKNWDVVKLTEIARLESGHTPRKDTPEYWTNGNIYWLSLQDIRALDGTTVMDTKFKTNKLGIENSSARLLPKGTVCFCRDISVGYVTILGKSMSTTQHFANWICSERINNKFLMYAFMASRDSLIRQGQGTTVKTIYMPALKEFHIQLPSVEEQVRIVNEIEKRMSAAGIMEESINLSLQHAEAIRQSILKKAFEGDLTV